TCGRAGILRLDATDQRPVSDKDPWQYREAGGWERDRALDSLRRVVRFVPEGPLPYNCAGELVAPSSVDPEGTRPFVRWSFATYGPLRLVSAACAGGAFCPTGGIRAAFSTPVRGSEVQRRVRLLPEVPFAIGDTASESETWHLETTLAPHTAYAVVVDTAIRDVFGQRLTGNPAAGFRTTGFAPMVEHEYGRMTVERTGYRTLGVRHVNADSLDVIIAPVPDSLIPAMLQYSRWERDDSVLSFILKGATRRRVVVPGPRDRVRIYGVPVPAYNMQRPSAPVLQLLRVSSPALPPEWRDNQPYAVVQVTDLAVHAKIGVAGGVVWVTGVNDGKPRGGADVKLHDRVGRLLARSSTGPDGVAVLTGYEVDSTVTRGWGLEGYVTAGLGNDRGLTSISSYDPDLSPWQFNVRSGYGAERHDVAALVFTERGIYRPGETIHAKGIVRHGRLGALTVPAPSDSARWLFADRDGGTLHEATVPLSLFGTTERSFVVPADVPLGTYVLSLEQRRGGEWLSLANTTYRIGEYRPPEFLVEAVAGIRSGFPGDTVSVQVEARYLFGAPMARAALSWSIRQATTGFWDLDIPDAAGYTFGETGWWWEEDEGRTVNQYLESGEDTLDLGGRSTIRFALAAPPKGRPALATVEVAVTDVNRQSVGAAAATTVHPAAFYLGAKPLGTQYFWTAGEPAAIAVIAVEPDGRRVGSVPVRGTIVRREWHRVHRTRGGYSEVYGEWVSDTVASCSLRTRSDQPVECRFTPPSGGSYIVQFTSEDAAGRPVATSLYRWATGPGFVPWSDASQFKMDVVPDRTRYTVGDTATILFAAPFTDAEAWVTVEREGVIEQRRLRVTAGATTLKFPITEAWAPNAYVGIVMARGRSARPGPLDDPGRPTIRVGYAEVKVTPEVKRLTVSLAPGKPEYRPGDTASVRVEVRDQGGRGHRSEVTLWAVDQGVLALTGYRTPDPIDLLYRARGLGLRLSSNLTTVAPQVPEGEKGSRSPGGGGGLGESDLLRSRFRTTAFFLGSVITDSAGRAAARAPLPDNLTTFRIMAVAVTAGDRYGSGESPMLVTRPLVARPALPRFLREGDRFTAGVVVNQRAGGTPTVEVRAEATGVALTGAATQRAVLEAGRGREVRFDFLQSGSGTATDRDSSVFRFGVKGAGDADLVQSRLAVRPAFRPRAWTVTGVVTDTATSDLILPAGLDPSRSRLRITVGSSPLGMVRGLADELRVYPYFCSEQVASTVGPLIALYRVQQLRPDLKLLKSDPRNDIASAIGVLSRRQRPDGGIGFWSGSDWTTPWLSAYAGLALLGAREAGFEVSDSVLARLGTYLRRSIDQPQPIRAPVVSWYDTLQVRLADAVAALDYLSRLGTPHIPAENEMLRNAPQLAQEDRARLATLLARRGATSAARGLLEPAWAAVRIEGRRATLPEEWSRSVHYFGSRLRPLSRLLQATLAVDSAHPLSGPMVETLVQAQRAGLNAWWNTQDYAAVVEALAAFDRRSREGAARGITVRAGGRTLISGTDTLVADSAFPLTGLLKKGDGGSNLVRLNLSAAGSGAPIYYYATVLEVPKERPVRPEDAGIKVERWYERFDREEPVSAVAEGELVRVRLRITLPADRQFVVVDDALPAGLEAVDLSLRTASLTPGPGTAQRTDWLTPAGADADEQEGAGEGFQWFYGSWDSGWWSPFDHREIRDDRVLYSATVLWKGAYTMTYIARATTPGTFVRPPAHAEEMYNPAV
ncbi:MAG: MG2 domain-containing protein, partial [Gemmatimonadota bacterium]|nr:MG2 domain-containing protein [Gemmatimonadota bacterium]